MKAIITRAQAIRIVRSEAELQRRLLNTFSGELARLTTGVKLFGDGWYGPNPTFELRSGTCDSDGSDIQETLEALERGESLLWGSKRGRR